MCLAVFFTAFFFTEFFPGPHPQDLPALASLAPVSSNSGVLSVAFGPAIYKPSRSDFYSGFSGFELSPLNRFITASMPSATKLSTASAPRVIIAVTVSRSLASNCAST